jgi:predicted NBD/HSP70 family sugar kinase
VRIAEASIRPDEDISLQSRPLQSRGPTQSGVRAYNERLVLALIRAHGSLPKAEIARLTGLSPQTVSVIVRQLEADQLVRKGEALRGKVGQPLQPYSLDPDGAFSIGLKVGRRSGDLVLLGLDGSIKNAVHHPYHFPSPHEFMQFAARGIEELTVGLGPLLRKRISGLGIAAPFEIWKWEEEAGAPHDVMEAWKTFNLTAEISKICDWPVLPCNDATAACAAELFFGKGQQVRDFAYIYVGYFVGGGLVIDGKLHQGPTGNAGAIGSIPVPRAGGGSEQLIRSASFYLLEKALRDSNNDPSMLWYAGRSWGEAGKALDLWIAHAADGLAVAAASLASALDCSCVFIDGAMPGDVRERLVTAVRQALTRVNLDGISPFEIEEGSSGFEARAKGAASLPLAANFMIDPDVLFRNAR